VWSFSLADEGRDSLTCKWDGTVSNMVWRHRVSVSNDKLVMHLWYLLAINLTEISISIN